MKSNQSNRNEGTSPNPGQSSSLLRRLLGGLKFGWIGKLRIRFRLMDMMWLALVSALLILWYKDHQSMSNQLASVNTRTSWSVRQVLGLPDTPRAGDYGTAWASASQDSGVEWLIVEFPRSVKVSKIQRKIFSASLLTLLQFGCCQ